NFCCGAVAAGRLTGAFISFLVPFSGPAFTAEHSTRSKLLVVSNKYSLAFIGTPNGTSRCRDGGSLVRHSLFFFAALAPLFSRLCWKSPGVDAMLDVSCRIAALLMVRTPRLRLLLREKQSCDAKTVPLAGAPLVL